MSEMNVNEDERTLWCGNLHEKVTDEILYELFLQAGPLEKVKIVNANEGKPRFSFVTFKHKSSVEFSRNLMNGIQLFGKSIKLQFRDRNGSIANDNLTPSSNQQPNKSNFVNGNVVNSNGSYGNNGALDNVNKNFILNQQKADIDERAKPGLLNNNQHADFHRSFSQPEFIGNGRPFDQQWNTPVGKAPNDHHRFSGLPPNYPYARTPCQRQPLTPGDTIAQVQQLLLNQANNLFATPSPQQRSNWHPNRSFGGPIGRHHNVNGSGNRRR